MISAPDLAMRLSLRKYPRSWRGACPACGYARAFSLRAPKDKLPLVYCSNGCDRDTLLDTMQRVTGDSWKAPERDITAETNARARKQAAAHRLIESSVQAAGTLAERYLAGRGLAELARCPDLHFRSVVWHPEGGKHPALVAAVRDAGGAIVAAHRTYLGDATARKANVEPAKASLGPVWGGAIRLHPAAEEIVVGEGIETAASAGKLLGLPAWAAVSAGNMARAMQLPPELRSVVIAADPDPAGQAAARDAWKRWTAEGRTVRIATPDRADQDFNDVLMEAANG